MRWPRVRISLGKLLLVVAVVAANCAAIRLLERADLYQNAFAERYWLDRDEVLIAFLPLIDAALFGAIIFGARAIRRLRDRRAEAPRRSPAGFTYFSVHFLAIACALLLLMPDGIDGYLLRLGPIGEYAERACARFVAEERVEDVSRFLSAVIAGVVLSGPLLLLALVGGLLAKRYAARASRTRFRTTAALVSLGFAGVAFAIAATPQEFDDEEREVAFDFRVIDGESGRPIAAAFVCLTDSFAWRDPPPSRAITGADGRAAFTARFPASGERNAFRAMGRFPTWGRWLHVSAPDYRAIRVALPEVLSQNADLESPHLRTVSLSRGRTPEPAFRDIAGKYAWGMGFGGCGYTIEDEGRFSWNAWGCSYHHDEYGYLKRHGDELEFVPVPRPFEEVHPRMTLKHRVVAWGDQRFLASDDSDIRKICLAALDPSRRPKPGSISLPRRDFDFETLLMGGPDERPLVGLPRLPATVWANFFLGEMSLRDEDSLLRRGLAALIPTKLRRDQSEPVAVSF